MTRPLLIPCLLSVLLPACAPQRHAAPTAPATPGSFVADGSKYYAEELEGSRLHIFGRAGSHRAFLAAGRKVPIERMRTLPGRGPEAQGRRTTLLIEYTPDEPAMEKRLRRTAAQRYGLTLE